MSATDVKYALASNSAAGRRVRRSYSWMTIGEVNQLYLDLLSGAGEKECVRYS